MLRQPELRYAMEFLLGLIVLLVVAAAAFIIVLNRPPGGESDIEPDTPEREGTSYEEPQDEGRP